MIRPNNIHDAAVEPRERLLNSLDYTKDNAYSDGHKDALSDGDVKGKGTNSGYTHFIPDHTGGAGPMKHQLDTDNGGGFYDIEGNEKMHGPGGRRYLEGINMYSKGKKDYSENDKLWAKKSLDGEPGSEYNLPDLGNGRGMKPTLNTFDGGNNIDRDQRLRNEGINKYSEIRDYRNNIFRPTIDGEVGW